MRSRIAAALAALIFVAGACGSGDDGDKDAISAADTALDPATSTTAVVKVPAPLTGLPVDEDVAERPVVSVKVDNSDEGRAGQTGIDKADVLFEEKVEGTVTRFIAVFQSEDADLVGPIRSVRTTDAPIVSAFGGVFTYAGGAPTAVRSLRNAPVKSISEDKGSAPFTYPPGKHRPYATFAKTRRLRQEAPDTAKPPSSFVTFLAQGETYNPTGATPATKATVVYGSRTTAVVDWDAASSTWLRSTNGKSHTIQNGGQLAFTTVIIQSVKYRGVGYKDAAKHPVDEAVVVGEGEAVILAQGKQVKARWKKESASAMTTYTDSSGAPIRFPQGQILVMLPPTSGGITIV